MPENNPPKSNINTSTLQYNPPGPAINVFGDRDANAALRNAILGTAGSALKNSIKYGIENRQADKALFNHWLGVRNQLAQMQGYSDYADICLTGDCPTRPFLGDPPTFKDWRRGDEDFGDSRDEYREYLGPVYGYSDTPLRNKGIVRDALVTGAGTAATTYLGNKLLGSFPAGRRLQDNFEFKFGLGPARRYQPGGSYDLPTSATTSGYTSNMTAMPGSEQAQQLLEESTIETAEEKERRLKEEIALQKMENRQLGQDAIKEVSSNKFRDSVGNMMDGFRLNRAIKNNDLIQLNNTITAGRAAAEAASPTANVVMNPMYTEGAKQVMDPSFLNVGKEVGVNAVSDYGTDFATNQANNLLAQQAAREAAKSGSKFGLSATSANPSWANPAATAAAFAGKGIEYVADDNDDTKTTFGEGFGRGLSGAGQGASIGLMFGPVGGLIGAGIGATAALLKQRKEKKDAIKEESRNLEMDANIAAAERDYLEQAFSRSGVDMGYNVGNTISNSYVPGYQQGVMAQTGGAKLEQDILLPYQLLDSTILTPKSSATLRYPQPSRIQLPRTDYEYEYKAKSEMESGGWPWPDKEARILNRQKRQTKKAQKLFEKASKKAKRKGGSALDYMR